MCSIFQAPNDKGILEGSRLRSATQLNYIILLSDDHIYIITHTHTHTHIQIFHDIIETRMKEIRSSLGLEEDEDEKEHKVEGKTTYTCTYM